MRRTLILASVLIGLVVLYCFPPETHSFYPVCLFHQYTGMLCPGCGATRAVAALLHGDPADAWHLNPLTVAMLPLAAVYGALAWRWNRWPTLPASLVSSLLAVAALFTVLRNVV